MNVDGICSPGRVTVTMPNDDKSSTCQQLMNRLEQLNNSPTTTNQSKKQVWLQFVSLWCEVLQSSPSDTQLCYDECARLLPLLLTSTDFHSIIQELYVSRESFFACIVQLDQSRIRDYLLLANDEQNLPENRMYYSHVKYLLMIAAQVAVYIPFATIDDQRFIDNHVELFTRLIERVEQSMPEHFERIVQKNHELGAINERILNLLWYLADRTVLVPTLLKCGLANRVVGWLSQSDMLTEKGWEPLISIVHNIARHDDGADELNKHGAIEIVKRYQYLKLEKMDSRILVCSMALALLSTPEQLKRDKKGMNIALNQLLQLVMDAARGDQHRYDGFHVSEPLGIMVKMFVVEERTLDYVLYHAETEPASDMISTIRLFVSLFFEFSDALKGTDRLEQFTLIALLNILWSISFQQNYAQELITNQKLIVTIKMFTEDDNGQEMVEQYKPRSMEGVKQAAHGILHNLNENSNSSKNETVSEEQSTVLHALAEGRNAKPWIMISYSHDNNTFCDQILNLVATCNETYEVWVDRTYCQAADDLWESIADGMEQACVIVCLLSSQYFESKSCRKEFIYATDSLKKRIVPVLLENFEPKGWLGIRMTGMKYVRFRHLVPPEQAKMTELLNTILSSLSTSASLNRENLQPQSRHHSIPLPVPTVRNQTSTLRPFDQWTSASNDIHTWFVNNRISMRLHDLFEFQTSKEMLDYAQLVIEDREKQMDIYATIFAEKYNGKQMPPHEFNRFAIALEQLYRDNPPPLSHVKQNSSVPIESSTCDIL